MKKYIVISKIKIIVNMIFIMDQINNQIINLNQLNLTIIRLEKFNKEFQIDYLNWR